MVSFKGVGDLSGFSPQGVFLSYRRDDAGPYARSLQHDLKQRFPDAPIFMDVDSIEAGLDFAEVIEERVNSCAVLVALIGPQWAALTDADGARRLDNPDDYVRFEVKTALERRVRVIPVLIDGARPLRQQELPADLHKLARLNAHKLSYDRYQDDADRLLELIQRVLAAAGEQEEAERKDREEADRKAQQEAERKDREEAERKAQEEADREAREEELRVRERKARSVGEAGDAAGARDQLASLLPERARVSGPEHLDTLKVRYDLAHWTGKAGDPAGARDQYAALLSVVEQNPGRAYQQYYIPVARYGLARWTGEAGDPAGARDQYAELASAAERDRGSADRTTLTLQASLARWTGEAGDPAGACDQYAALLPEMEHWLGPDHSDTRTARSQASYWADKAEADRKAMTKAKRERFRKISGKLDIPEGPPKQ
jgi:hypothetical protein